MNYILFISFYLAYLCKISTDELKKPLPSTNMKLKYNVPLPENRRPVHAVQLRRNTIVEVGTKLDVLGLMSRYKV